MRYLVMILLFGMVTSIVANIRPPSSSSVPTETFTVASDSGYESRSAGSATGGGQATSADGALNIERSSDGHFYADVDLNGARVNMLVDTGATGIALSREDARTAGIATSIGMNDVVGQGADGSVHGEYVTIDRMTLGSQTQEQVRAVVLDSGERSLLGQSFLKRFASVEIHGDTMTLR